VAEAGTTITVITSAGGVGVAVSCACTGTMHRAPTAPT
jgi:hypothetical protein